MRHIIVRAPTKHVSQETETMAKFLSITFFFMVLMFASASVLNLPPFQRFAADHIQQQQCNFPPRALFKNLDESTFRYKRCDATTHPFISSVCQEIMRLSEEICHVEDKSLSPTEYEVAVGLSDPKNSSQFQELVRSKVPLMCQSQEFLHLATKSKDQVNCTKECSSLDSFFICDLYYTMDKVEISKFKGIQDFGLLAQYITKVRRHSFPLLGTISKEGEAFHACLNKETADNDTKSLCNAVLNVTAAFADCAAKEIDEIQFLKEMGSEKSDLCEKFPSLPSLQDAVFTKLANQTQCQAVCAENRMIICKALFLGMVTLAEDHTPEKTEDQTSTAKESQPQENVEGTQTGKTVGQPPEKIGDKTAEETKVQQPEKTVGQSGDKTEVQLSEKTGGQPGDKTEKTGDKPVNKTNVQPPEKIGDNTAEQTKVQQPEKTVGQPGDKTEVQPSEKTMGQPGDKTEKTGDKPVDEAKDQSPEKTAGQPGENTEIQQPEKTGDQSPEKTQVAPPEKTGDQLEGKTNVQPPEQTGDQSTKKTGDQFAEETEGKTQKKTDDHSQLETGATSPSNDDYQYIDKGDEDDGKAISPSDDDYQYIDNGDEDDEKANSQSSKKNEAIGKEAEENDENKQLKKMPSKTRFDDDEGKGGISFMSYFLVFTVLVVAGYLVFHNKQKIIALVVEGKNSGRNGRRPNSKEYRQLKTEDVMPSLEKTASSKNYVF